MSDSNTLKKLQKALDEYQKENESLKSVLKKKDNVIANFNHEILTPANSIFGLLDLALEQEIPPQLKSYLEKVKEACNQLKRVTDNLRSYSDFEETDDINAHDFEVYDFFEQLLIKFNPVALRKKNKLFLIIGSSVPYHINCDESRLDQIVGHLIENANKFTENGVIVIRLSSHPDNENIQKLQISIQDTGIGISKEIANSIFDAYVQGDGTSTRTYGGTGIGLTVAKQLATSIGGDIVFKTEQNKGTEFIVSLPVKTMDLMPAAKYQFNNDIKDKLVLIASEDKLRAESLGNLLNNMGMSSQFSDGYEALMSALEIKQPIDTRIKRYQVMLIDWKLFFDMADEIMQLINSYNRAMRVVFINGDDESLVIPKDISKGYLNNISSPFTRNKIFNVINTTVNVSDTEWNSCFSNIVNWIQQLKTNTDDKVDFDNDQENLLHSLEASLKEGNYSEIVEALNTIKQQHLQLFSADILSDLENAVLEFDFSHGLELIQKALNKKA